MAQSLIGGLLAAGHTPSQLSAADPSAQQRSRVAELGINTGAENQPLVDRAEVIVLAVKPQILSTVLSTMTLAPTQLLISIAAGVTLDAITHRVGVAQPVVRCMPNTPALVQAGISGLYANAAVSDNQRDSAETILRAAGDVVWVQQEHELDAVTALSGSGPAYFFYLMEAMITAGTQLGLSEDTATQLTLATAAGSAKMATSVSDSPAQLRRNVTSPGGTTERALSILEQRGTQTDLVAAVVGAAARAQELGIELAKDFERP